MDRNETGKGRREFLKAIGIAGVGAVVATAAPTGDAQGAETAEEQVKGRYSLSPHVERFYFLNRL
ncbi:MAG TPA: twin-arginine translocation signal domain-containing protein [Arenibaculum sp.]|nr:twin-arginine translocation signal domain-containing protein [Arenibaculum sp.]